MKQFELNALYSTAFGLFTHAADNVIFVIGAVLQFPVVHTNLPIEQLNTIRMAAKEKRDAEKPVRIN